MYQEHFHRCIRSLHAKLGCNTAKSSCAPARYRGFITDMRKRFEHRSTKGVDELFLIQPQACALENDRKQRDDVRPHR